MASGLVMVVMFVMILFVVLYMTSLPRAVLVPLAGVAIVYGSIQMNALALVGATPIIVAMIPAIVIMPITIEVVVRPVVNAQRKISIGLVGDTDRSIGSVIAAATAENAQRQHAAQDTVS
jgi:hypothetical protein